MQEDSFYFTYKIISVPPRFLVARMIHGTENIKQDVRFFMWIDAAFINKFCHDIQEQGFVFISDKAVQVPGEIATFI